MNFLWNVFLWWKSHVSDCCVGGRGGGWGEGEGVGVKYSTDFIIKCDIIQLWFTNYFIG